MDEFNLAQIKETKEWAVEVGNEEFGQRWREFAPLLIRRIPGIIDQYLLLFKEIEAVKLDNEGIRTDLDAEKALARRYVDAAIAIGAETPEALTDAVRDLKSRLTAFEQERDDAVALSATLQSVLEDREVELDELRPLVPQLALSKTHLDELQDAFDDLQSRFNETQQRALDLEQSLEQTQEDARVSKTETEEYIVDVRSQAEETIRQTHLLLQEAEEKLQSKDEEFQQLLEKIQSLKDSVNEAILT